MLPLSGGRSNNETRTPYFSRHHFLILGPPTRRCSCDLQEPPRGQSHQPPGSSRDEGGDEEERKEHHGTARDPDESTLDDHIERDVEEVTGRRRKEVMRRNFSFCSRRMCMAPP